MSSVTTKDYNLMMKRAFGVKPTQVDAQNALRTIQYKERLLNIIKGRFEITCPMEWDKDYMLDALLTEGKFCITDTVVGIMPLQCGVAGQNQFLRPTTAIISNVALGSFERIIGSTCEMVYLKDSREMKPINELVNLYAQKLASCDASIDMNLLNSKVAMLFKVKDKKQSETVKEMYTKIQQGEPLVVVDDTDMMGDGGFNPYFLNVKNNWIAGDVQDAKRTIMNEFLTAVGINNANTDKRERLNGDEVNANNEELEYNIAYWKKNLKRCTDRVNALFPNLNFNIELTESEGEL